MIIKNKKYYKSGFILAEVLLAVTVIGVIITGLLTFFNFMQQQDKSEQMAAMGIVSIHSNLRSFPLTTVQSNSASSQINKTTDILPLFPHTFKNDAANVKSILMGNIIKFNFNNGLEISFNKNTISCPQLLKYDLGFDLISNDGFVNNTTYKADIRSLNTAINFCSTLPSSKIRKTFWLKDGF